MTLSTIKYLIKKWLENNAAKVDQRSILKNVYAEVEISPGYFLILNIANLIALSGLITNSSPVIIGAMLISPLMGPILNVGFAFVTGDNVVWQKSFRKIAFSVGLTLLVAAAATLISPMKDITNEIIVRTRPNLYDLIIAFLAGLAGAGAICTKKNYLTIVPGVAIATAVIPPLSVAGFGIGIWNYKIFLGGFFLFFTNFVAIIISTCIVFYIYGFKPSIITEVEISKLKKRVAILGVVLFVISLPLLYTLHKSIDEVRLRGGIQDALKKEFDKDQLSKLASFGYSVEKNGMLNITANINTVHYLTEADISTAIKNIKGSLDRKLKVDVEQFLVQSGGLKEGVSMNPGISQQVEKPAPQTQTTADLRKDLIAIIARSSGRIGKMMSPSEIADLSVGFSEKSPGASVILTVRRDTPLTDEEVLWLKQLLADELDMPVDLKVQTEPFIPPLVFKEGETGLTEDMKKELAQVSEVFKRDSGIVITVESYQGAPPRKARPARRRAALTVKAVKAAPRPEAAAPGLKSAGPAEQRAEAVTDELVNICKIPVSNIKTVIRKDADIKTPTVRVSILPAPK
jgi:uncharacterized hydrophobic protein (TIGR00271 family)